MSQRSNPRSDRAARRRDRPYPGGRVPGGGPERGPGTDHDRGREAGSPESGARSALTAYRALLPLRLFLGATFVYAGLDKIVDPRFLHDTGPGSIGEQLVGFTHISPLAPLIQLTALQAPVLVGLLIALAEIAIGLATLTGLLYRLAATGGFALSIMFWLTASWATKPYYYGPDLPYALGWLTIGLAGHGGLYVLDGAWDRWASGRIVRARYGDYAPVEEVDAWTADPARRGFLQATLVGGVTIGIAGLFGLLGHRHGLVSALGLGGAGETPRPTDLTGGGTTVGDASGSPTASPADGAGATPAASSGGGATPAAGGTLVGRVDQVKAGRALAFQVPSTGDPAYLLRLPDGKIVAYDAVCTHAGCTVDYDRGSGLLICPCHGATFDPGHNAQPVAGPTDTPLARLPIKVDTATGRITLAG